MLKIDALSKLLDTDYEQDWEDRLCNKPDVLKDVLTDVDGPDLIKALRKSMGCDCCADGDFYNIRGYIISELAYRAGIKED